MAEPYASTPQAPPLVVVVDDEEKIVQTLQTLLEVRTNYTVRGFNDPVNAARFIEDTDVSTVISDYMMPEMDGLELLNVAKTHRPDAPRILLTGNADRETAIRAINEVGLFQYIEKPWENDHLLLVLKNAVERWQLVRELQARLEEIGRAHEELHGLHREIVRAFV